MKTIRFFTLLLLIGLIASNCSSETKPQEEDPTYVKPAQVIEPKENINNYGNYVRDEKFDAAMEAYPFDSVSWMAIDPNTEYLYVLQRTYPPVSVWTTNGEFITEWETMDLGYPHSISISYSNDEGTIWITDFAPPQSAGNGWGHCVKQFSLSGEYLGSIGSCGENSQGSGLDPVQFDKVTDVATDRDGNMFITDGDLGGLNNRVLKMNVPNHVIHDWSAPDNQPGSGPMEYNLPHAVEVDAIGRIWIVDALNSRIQVMTDEGEYLGAWRLDPTLAPNGIGIGDVVDIGGVPMANVAICSRPTDLKSSLQANVVVSRAVMNAEEPANFGNFTPIANWTEPDQNGSAMLHSCTSSKTNSAIFLAYLNKGCRPFKYIQDDAQK